MRADWERGRGDLRWLRALAAGVSQSYSSKQKKRKSIKTSIQDKSIREKGAEERGNGHVLSTSKRKRTQSKLTTRRGPWRRGRRS